MSATLETAISDADPQLALTVVHAMMRNPLARRCPRVWDWLEREESRLYRQTQQSRPEK